jgi:hypothetical protein
MNVTCITHNGGNEGFKAFCLKNLKLPLENKIIHGRIILNGYLRNMM